MWLVVGLGNPGSKYERNRHNIGFLVVEELVRRHGLPAFSASATKPEAETTAGMITTERGRERCQLLKPMGFMNLSGFATQRTAAFHKVPIENILVVHDELDLDFGIVRLKKGGGHGGHNGLRSMIEQLGGNGFARVRMGIGRAPDGKATVAGAPGPPGGKDAAGWVLSDFPAALGGALDRVIRAGCEDVQAVLGRGIVPAMNQHNARSNCATS